MKNNIYCLIFGNIADREIVLNMDFNAKEFIEQLNLFGGRLFSYNHLLLKRSEDKSLHGKESFEDIIDFYLTSQAQCFIKDFFRTYWKPRYVTYCSLFS